MWIFGGGSHLAAALCIAHEFNLRYMNPDSNPMACEVAAMVTAASMACLLPASRLLRRVYLCPVQVYSVDCNPAQNALLELKALAIR